MSFMEKIVDDWNGSLSRAATVWYMENLKAFTSHFKRGPRDRIVALLAMTKN